MLTVLLRRATAWARNLSYSAGINQADRVAPAAETKKDVTWRHEEKCRNSITIVILDER